MKEWILFGLIIFVGLGMLISGVVYMSKEKNDPESVNIYRVVSVIGLAMALGSCLMKFVF